MSRILSTGEGLQAHTRGGVEGSGWERVSRPTPRGRLMGLARGVSRPTSRGWVEGSGWGRLRGLTRGSSGPHPGGGFRFSSLYAVSETNSDTAD